MPIFKVFQKYEAWAEYEVEADSRQEAIDKTEDMCPDDDGILDREFLNEWDVFDENGNSIS